MIKKPLHIGLVAGEKSGDLLGAELIRALKRQLPTAQFSGLGGTQMQAVGFHSIADMERLSVMGLIEPLKRLPDLFALRRQLVRHFLGNGKVDTVDLLVTIDSPDFNLGLAKQVRVQGVPVCHYVCPSVWAWRQGRVKKIRASVDHVLALLPFESNFLQRHGVGSTFVGHPLAEQLAPVPFADSAKTKKATLCVMPGSRHSEVAQLAPLFLATVEHCLASIDDLQVIIPAATDELNGQLRRLVVQAGLSLNRVRVEPCEDGGRSVEVMRQADVVLMASGTATLEAGLLGKPMVVAYRMSPLGHTIAKRLVKVPYIALPNLLLDKPVVPELIQENATPEKLAASLLELLHSADKRQAVSTELAAIHAMLAVNASERAADAVIQLLPGDENANGIRREPTNES